MPKRTKRYEEKLIEDLKNPREAAAYLNAHLEGDEGDADELFLMALRDVAKAYGFGAVAAKAELGRESLYKTLSESGNPKWATMKALLDAIGLRIHVDVKEA